MEEESLIDNPNKSTVLETGYGSYQDTTNKTSINNDAIARDLAPETEESEHFSFKTWLTTPTVSKVAIGAAIYSLSMLSGAVVESLYFERACDSNRDSQGYCDAIDNQILVSNFQQAKIIIGQIVTIIAISNLGKFCDKYGKRLAFMLIGLTELLGNLWEFMLLTEYHEFKFKSILAASAVLSSLMGTIFGYIAVTNAYVNDISKPENKSSALAFSLAMLAAGQFVGTFIGTFLLNLGKQLGYDKDTYNKFPYYIQFIDLVLLIVYNFYLPESPKFIRPIESQTSNVFSHIREYLANFKISWKTRNPLKLLNVFEQLHFLTIPDDIMPQERQHEAKKIRFLVSSLIFTYICGQLYSAILLTVLVQYCIYLFDWGSPEISNLLLIASAGSFISLLVLLPFINKVLLQKVFKLDINPHHFDSVDFGTLFFAMVIDILSSIGFIIAKTSNEVLMVLPFACVDVFIGPTVTSTITKYFPEDLSGRAVISLNLVGAIVRAVGPICLLLIYKFGLKHNFANLPFYFQTLIFVIIGGFLVIDKIASKSR